MFYILICRKQCGQVVLDVLKERPLDEVLEHIHQIASTLCMASEDTGNFHFIRLIGDLIRNVFTVRC